jgi:hypothetical protein
MKTVRRWSEIALFFIAAISSLALFSFSDAGAAQKTSADITKLDNNMLQFKAGNHILGFTQDKAYLASLDHALSVQFLGTKSVMPKSDTNAPATGSMTKASPLVRVVYQNLWDGISLTYVAAKDGITESTYHVAPGADVSKIRLKYNVPVELLKDGSLMFKFAAGNLTESAPVAWQEIDRKKVPVMVAFKIDQGEVAFRVGRYDKEYPLVIDPTYAWHTFYGSSSAGSNGADAANAIAVDNNGAVYVAGRSCGTWNRPGNIAPIHAFSNGCDIGVQKLDSSGMLQWHTFYGAGDDDDTAGIAVDDIGNVYVTGTSWSSWDGQGVCLTPASGEPPCPRHAHGGSGQYDFFVLKLGTGGEYIWHTFYGSYGADFSHGIALDSNRNIFVTGASYATWSGPTGQPKHDFSGAGNDNIFVLKLSGSGDYLWHTFYGSAGDDDVANGATVDNNDNVYVTGSSDASWNGPTNQSPKHDFSGSGDLFVLKLNYSGDYDWHAFYLGNGAGIAVDEDNNIYVAGSSSSAWNGPEGQPPRNGYSGYGEILVLKLDSSGAYQLHGFYGSASSGDWANGISIDGGGNAYITGGSNAGWGSPLHAHSGNTNIVVLKLLGSGAYQWHTFYGSGSGDDANGIAADGSGNVYTAGASWSSWGSPLNPHNSGFGDIFVLKLNDQVGSAATVKTVSISSITSTGATVAGNVTSDGGTTVTARGACWSPSANPTITGIHTINGSGTGAFDSAIIGLSPYSTYHVRAYATNSAGTAYGEDISFTTNLCTSDVQRGGPYETIQDAIGGSGPEIKAVARVFQENLSFSNSSALAFTGGYTCGFGPISGLTTLHGTITIAGSGGVILANVAVY